MLHRVQGRGRPKALDGGDLITIVHDSQGEAAVDATAFNDYGTGTTLPLVATLFASGEVQVFAEGIEQRRAWVEL
jgi:hypothetical protein